MSGFLVGLALGLVPYALGRVDSLLARFGNDQGPIREWWGSIRWRLSRRIEPIRSAIATAVLATPPIAALLRLRPWRVTYINECMYGGPPNGWTPYTAGETWHWTERGAEWRRRHRPLGTTWGSSMIVTAIDKSPDTPLDPVTKVAS